MEIVNIPFGPGGLFYKVKVLYDVLQGLHPEHGLLKYFEIKDSGMPRIQIFCMNLTDPRIMAEFYYRFGGIRQPTTDNFESFQKTIGKYLNALEDAIFHEVFKTHEDLEGFLQHIAVKKSS